MRRHIIITSIALWLSCMAQAEVLTLDSCVQMALRNNREIKSSQIRTQEQLQTQKAYKANYFPNITANGNYLNDFNNHTFDTHLTNLIPGNVKGEFQEFSQALLSAIGQYDPQLAQRLANISDKISLDYNLKNIYSFGVTLAQPIYMGGKITAAYNMSKLGMQMARQNEKLTREDVIVKTYEAYSLLLKATEMHRVALQYDSLLTQLKTDVENAEKHGLRGHNEVLKVQVKKNEAQLQIVQAENAIKLARMNLCHHIGCSLSDDVQIAEVKAEGVQASQANASVNTRPEFDILELKSELAREKVKLARSEFLPQVGVQVSSSYVHGGEVAGGTLFNSKTPYTMALVNLSVPIWHGNEAQHKVKAAKLEYERTLVEQQDQVEKMNLEMQQCANVLDESIVELELAKTSVEQAGENLRNSRRAFDVGLETLSELLEAQTLWQEACAKKAIAESQLIVNRVKYEKACGQL